MGRLALDVQMNTLWLRFLQTHKTAHAELTSLLETRWEVPPRMQQ